jgi:hypothetical protein
MRLGLQSGYLGCPTSKLYNHINKVLTDNDIARTKTANPSGLKMLPDPSVKVPAMLFTYLTGSVTVPPSAEEPIIPLVK